MLDLNSLDTVNTVPGFFAPIVADPNHPGHILAIQNIHKKGIVLRRINPQTNHTQTIVSVNKTTLGKDLRAQDQASMAVDSHGSVWLIASYNVPSGDLIRGVFKLELRVNGSSGVLVSQVPAFGDKISAPWIGRLDYFG